MFANQFVPVTSGYVSTQFNISGCYTATDVALLRQSPPGADLRNRDRTAGVHVPLSLLRLSRFRGATASLSARPAGAGAQGAEALCQQLPGPSHLP